MKILVPVDGSENSLRAAQYVLGMAKTHPSLEVTLLTVACFYDSRYMADTWVNEEQLNRQCELTFARKLAEAKKIFEDAGVFVNTVLLSGDPAESIISFVETEGIDKVVMGSRGLSPFKGMIFGSVTYKVLSSVKVPVTIIK